MDRLRENLLKAVCFALHPVSTGGGSDDSSFLDAELMYMQVHHLIGLQSLAVYPRFSR
jgi:hypothetical protein